MAEGGADLPRRVSQRKTKGVPPALYGYEVVTPQLPAGSQRSVKTVAVSKASTASQRKEAEAKRDESLAQLNADFADKLKKKTELKRTVKLLKVALNGIRVTLARDPGNLALMNREAKLLEEIETNEEDIQILEAEKASIQSSEKAVKSRCDADLEILEENEEDGASVAMSIEDGEAQENRVKTWIESVAASEDGNGYLDLGHVTDSEKYRNLSNVWRDSKSTKRKDGDFRAQGAARVSGYDSDRTGYYSSESEREDDTTTKNALPKESSPSSSKSETSKNEDMVSTLVTALGQAFGERRNQVILKAPVDKDLPKFNGNPGDWENFRCEYQRTTRKYKYEDSDNLTRIRKALEGDALGAVKHLLSNPKNLTHIWNTLEKRFGRPEFVLDYLVEEAKATRPPEVGKPESLIQFGTAIEALVTNVCAYNEEEYLYNRQIVTEFVGKLPPTMKTQWHEWLLDDKHRKPNLKYFSKWLARKVDAAILAVKPRTTESKTEEKRGRRGPGSFNVTYGADKQSDDSTCVWCGRKNHTLPNCWKFQKMKVDDRWKVVKERRLCICCLQFGHRSRECKQSLKCAIDGCKYFHHALLHSTAQRIGAQTSAFQGLGENLDTENSHERNEDLRNEGSPSSSPQNVVEATGSFNVAVIEGCDGPLRMLPVVIKDRHGKASLSKIGFQDPGCSRTIMSKSLSEELQLPGEKIPKYRYKGVTGEWVEVEDAIRHEEVLIAGTFSGARFQKLTNVITVDTINLSPYTFRLSEAQKLWPHLRKLRGPDLLKVIPDIIIGNDNPNALLPNRVVRGNEGDPIGLRTPLGWTVAGDFEVKPGYGTITATMCGVAATDDYLHNLMKAWWSTEEFGVKASTRKGKTIEEQRAWQILEETTKRVDGGWETGLLYKENNLAFPPSKASALNRLIQIERKMRDPVFAAKYNDKFAEYLEKGYMRKLNYGEASVQPPKTWYLPHFGEVNPNKPDKFRFITDAKAKVNGVSLNDKLLTGPDLIRPLTSVLLNFRIHKIGLTGDIADMFHRVRQISEINEAGGFKVCKYLSNSMEVLMSIPEELRAGGIKGLEEKQDIPSERVLGLWWDPNDDAFGFKLALHKVSKRVLEGEIPTKREMCGLVMSLYDPLGFISQYKVKGLMVLQNTWRVGSGWDDEVPQDINEQWQTWLGYLQEITKVKVPRCYSFMLSEADVQLHIFQDASEEGFCSVCYLRIQKRDEVETAFLFSKARVAPLKKLTIPKLELQAAILGTRMASMIGQVLRVPISSRWFWSDSKTVLCWIRSTGVRYKEFVANRIGEIQESTNADEWHWVPTKLNVADQGTRFTSKISMEPDSEWYTGPSFLKLDPTQYPQESNSGDVMCSAIMSEAIIDYVTRESSKELQRLRTVIPNPLRFSSFLRLVRATAAVIKVNAILTKECAGMYFLEPDDIYKAERMLVKLAQEESYAEEMKCLRRNLPLSRKSDLWRLCPELDNEGVIRMKGRVGTPAILPNKHYISQLLIDQEHRNCAHQGFDTVFTNIRQKYWIPDGRSAVMQSWGRCWVCKLARAKPIPPQMGNLPTFRLASYQPPFSCTGLDFFGPMYVTVGRQHHKRWGALFCCQVTRAVHLEVCHDLSTDEVMMALSRFVDSRRRPNLIVSDNGTNFVGAAKELKKAFKEADFNRIKGMGRFQEIKWVFNPPAAPHMGGSWERLVQSVKKCLKSVLHEKYPKDTTLLTMMKSVENIVNSRPLTHVSPDPADPEPITPNHILRGGSDVGPSIPCKMDHGSDYLRAQWKRGQIMADQFWRRWTREFLPKLNRREKWIDSVEPLRIGDLVFMAEDNLPRNCWAKGYISGVSAGSDGQVRVVRVTTKDPQTGRPVTYARPAVKVCPIGLRMEIQDPKDPKFGAGNVTESQLPQKKTGIQNCPHGVHADLVHSRVPKEGEGGEKEDSKQRTTVED